MTPAPLPAEEIERLKELLAEVTPGEWLQDDDLLQTKDGDIVIAVCPADDCPRGVAFFDNNMEFVVAAKNALPALLAEIEDLRQDASERDHFMRLAFVDLGTNKETWKERAERAEAEIAAGRAGAERVPDWSPDVDLIGSLSLCVGAATLPAEGHASGRHLSTMLSRMLAFTSERKFNRWVGYIQGVLVATGNGTVERFKAMNRDRPDAALRQAAQPADGAPFVPQQLPMPKYHYQQDGDGTPAAPAQVGAQPAGRVEADETMRVLVEAAIPLEVLAGQIRQRPYVEMSADFQAEILKTVDLIRTHVSIATQPTAGAVDDGEG